MTNIWHVSQSTRGTLLAGGVLYSTSSCLYDIKFYALTKYQNKGVVENLACWRRCNINSEDSPPSLMLNWIPSTDLCLCRMPFTKGSSRPLIQPSGCSGRFSTSSRWRRRSSSCVSISPAVWDGLSVSGTQVTAESEQVAHFLWNPAA